ncbi:4,5-dioxygenase [Photobacterium sanctipauli]|uniref:4,5-dioxygenase n=1 Tax=Photobacterium sanctipauli TaxID=1342794 RepID=A0A2T3NZV4_9GAMM|nr:DOPA 4,5-dioxygenase family protein [Photobacterium sanctipauli]PSW21816.1 4,5-dioxygenase [Photobacterium sanctipauli]
MEHPKRPVNAHDQYHAHVYFDNETLAFATDLCTTVGDKFGLKVGRIHQKPVGPHTQWSCQILFSRGEFEELIPWLDKHRGDLSILVHGSTGDDLADHTTNAYWLGDAVELDLSRF